MWRELYVQLDEPGAVAESAAPDGVSDGHGLARLELLDRLLLGLPHFNESDVSALGEYETMEKAIAATLDSERTVLGGLGINEQLRNRERD